MDFYFSGLRIRITSAFIHLDSLYYPICFNIALVYLDRQMFRNAQKWFRIANLLNSVSEEPLLGLALSMLKLG